MTDQQPKTIETASSIIQRLRRMTPPGDGLLRDTLNQECVRIELERLLDRLALTTAHYESAEKDFRSFADKLDVSERRNAELEVSHQQDAARIAALEAERNELRDCLALADQENARLRDAFTAHCVQCPQCQAAWVAALAAAPETP